MIGIDIIDINRFKNKNISFLRKIFSKRELDEAKNNNFYTKIAGKWAAKEAVYKSGIDHAFKNLEIITENNKPIVYLNRKKISAITSISHEKQYATAIVINSLKN